MKIEMRVIILVGMVWLSMTIMPSSAKNDSWEGLPICWQKMHECAFKMGLLGYFGGCCKVIRPAVANTTCFCSISNDHFKQTTNKSADDYKWSAKHFLRRCKINSTFDDICEGMLPYFTLLSF